MIKKIALGVIVLLVVLGVGAYFIGSNLGTFVKSAVEQYGSEATQAKVTLGKVDLSLSSKDGIGKGELGNFVLGNPQGFETDKAMSFAKVDVEIDAKSIAGNAPIVIRKILIDAPEINYEVSKSGGSNLLTIKDNIQSYVSTSMRNERAAPSSPEAKKAKDERKVIIESLIISNGQVRLSHALLADKNLDAVKLPTIQLTNLGKNSGGISAAMVAQVIIGQISSQAIAVGQSYLVDELKKQGLESLKGAVNESDVGKAVKGLFGK